MQQARRRSALALRLLLVLGLVAGLAACGDDDDEASTDTTQTTAGEEAAGADLATYCEKTFEIETIPEPDIDFDSLSEEEQREAVKQFAQEDLVPLADEIVAAAPPEVEDDIAVLAGALDEIAETGDFEAFETPEVEAASDRAHEFDVANCGWTRVDVTAVDYAFEGIPAELEAGETSFEFTNTGQEVHELVVLRKAEGTTESFDALLELPEEEAQAKTEFVAATFEEPGESGYAIAELTPGEYIALCFVPVGSTPDAGEDVEGPPHFTQGMRAEFTVS